MILDIEFSFNCINKTMFLSTKEIIFFILTFVVLFFFSKGALLMGPQLKIGNTISLLIMSSLGSLLLMLIYKFGIFYQVDSFHFEVSGPKRCQGFPYMQSSASPELQNYCKKLFSTPEGLAQYTGMNCTTPGFVGRPVSFCRTPMSNDKWENTMCNSHHDLSYPAVL